MSEMPGREVVVTGLGIVSCLGIGTEQVTESLRLGRSGIACDPERQGIFRSPLTGTIEHFDPDSFGITRKHKRSMSQPAIFAYASARQAITDAALQDSDLQHERTGVVFGNDCSASPVVEAIDIVREHGQTHLIGAGNAFRSMNSTVTMNLAAYLGMRGANWTISAACASGAHAIGQAWMMIRSGLQDVMIVGGAMEVSWEAAASFDALNVFSTRVDEPHKASRPFDKDRDGLVPSGGAACLVLESEQHARQRNARIYGRIAGYGFSSSVSQSMSQSKVEGLQQAMQMALDAARCRPEHVQYVNAHATSTPVGDLIEGHAIHNIFGNRVLVSSTKSMTGHECWMAGASEVVYTLLMAQGGFIAPNINFTQLDSDCPPIQIVSRTAMTKIDRAVSNSFGFGGTNASIVLDLTNSQRIS